MYTSWKLFLFCDQWREFRCSFCERQPLMHRSKSARSLSLLSTLYQGGSNSPILPMNEPMVQWSNLSARWVKYKANLHASDSILTMKIFLLLVCLCMCRGWKSRNSWSTIQRVVTLDSPSPSLSLSLFLLLFFWQYKGRPNKKQEARSTHWLFWCKWNSGQNKERERQA